eukprot:1744072-Rhodomonas_salina.2
MLGVAFDFAVVYCALDGCSPEESLTWEALVFTWEWLGAGDTEARQGRVLQSQGALIKGRAGSDRATERDAEGGGSIDGEGK